MAKIIILRFCLILTIVGVLNCETSKNECLVTVEQGKLQGSIEQLLDGSTYYSFKGIPYAQPPVGKLRFVAPLPPRPWHGIYDGTKYGPICPQYTITSNYEVLEGDEDCLFLNVYTRTLNHNAKKPVMVFIHGGSYLEGSGSDSDLGPKFLLQHDVILVTINYRLEVLGFLSLDIPEVPGNAGMKDQVAALKWVKKNIKQFGGDPNKVTLFGESSGSSSVTYHMLSHMSRGLFNQAIAESGVCIADWAQGKGAKERAFRAAKILGKDTNNTTELLQFFREVPVDRLVNLTAKTLTDDELHRGLKMHFVPVVEKRFDNVETFLSKKPIDILLSKSEINKVPLMLGYNSAEGLLNLYDELEKSNFTNENPQYLVPREIAEKVNTRNMRELGERIIDFYVGHKGFGNDTAEGVVNSFSDLHFIYNIHRFAYFYSLTGKPVYMYRFNLDTDLNLFKIYLELSQMKGACHGDELFYLFHGPLNDELYKSQARLKDIVYSVTKLWADFAKTGNPTPYSPSIQWPQYKRATKNAFSIDDNFAPIKFPEKERVEFLDQIYYETGLPSITNN